MNFSMEITKGILSFLGGLGMFLFGMELMADGLQQAAGGRMRHILSKLTGNPFSGVLCGALVTAIIQSSSAATVMVVGFVNAGLMNLTQACSVIMGANIGTTMTAWIVSMGQWASFLKPETIAPLLLFGGVALQMMASREKVKDGAKILIGFGILFSGLASMSAAASPIAKTPLISSLFTVLGSYSLLALLAGLAVTAIVQSSSASLGILQTLAIAGAVNWQAAVFIALGQNIGTCVTAMLSALSGDTNAKRAAAIHLEFNVIGALIAGTAAWILFALNPALGAMPVGAVGLAVFHSIFNIAITVILFPFISSLVALSKVLVPAGKRHQPLPVLDERLSAIPEAALRAVSSQIALLKKQCSQLIGESTDSFLKAGEKNEAENDPLPDEKARSIQTASLEIRSYLGSIDLDAMNRKEQAQSQYDLLAARDLYRIAQECVNLSALKSQVSGTIDDQAAAEISRMASACLKALHSISSKGSTAQFRLCYEEIHQSIEHLRSLSSHAGSDQLNFWIVLEAADCYESIARRIARLENEKDWAAADVLQPVLLPEA